MNSHVAILGALFLLTRAHAAPTAPPNVAVLWNNATLQCIRDAKHGAPVVSRALAIVRPPFEYREGWCSLGRDNSKNKECISGPHLRLKNKMPRNFPNNIPI
jgi:hypothetical protein